MNMEKKPPMKTRLRIAMDFYFDKGMTQKAAAAKGGICSPTLRRELENHRMCYHPDCTENHPCRAAKRLNKGKMACSALEDTDFGWFDCPFFKTEFDYELEYRVTNKMTDMEMKALGYK